MKKNHLVSIMIIFFVLVSLVVNCSISVYADEVDNKCGTNLTWSISDGVLTIEGTGSMFDFEDPDFGENLPGWWKSRREIKRVAIKNGVTTIGENAFTYMPNAESIVLPNTLVSIPDDTFIEWSKLKGIDIPASIRKIGKNAFPYTGSIEHVNVDPDNQVYSSRDGVLFNKKKTVLIYCPCKKSGTYYIPSTVQTIMPLAFYNVGIKTLHVPSSVKTVGEVKKGSKYTDYSEAMVYGKSASLHKMRAIYFHGNAPKGVLLNVGYLEQKVKMYYPDGNSTYTKSVQNCLDGKVIGAEALYSKKKASEKYKGIWKAWKPSSKKK